MPSARMLSYALAAPLLFVAAPSMGQLDSMTPMNEMNQTAQQADPVRTIAEWNLPKRGDKLAIDGYDPVAYFPEGGGKATKGKKSLTHTHKGVTYRFASQANLDLFKRSPGRYEAAHGGWCSWAMTQGGKTKPDPKNFIVKDDRLFLFYKGWGTDTRRQWLKGDHASLAATADVQWKTTSNELARAIALPQPAPADAGG